MNIDVKWCALNENEELWHSTRCLYAYLAPDIEEILYVGKSWGKTVRERWTYSGKENFWIDLEEQRGIEEHCPIIGEIFLDQSKRLSEKLLSDIESLIIINEQPWGNIQSKQSRISRPGLEVTCTGLWPGNEIYVDS